MQLASPEVYPAVVSLLTAVPFYTGFAESVLYGTTPGVVYINSNWQEYGKEPQVAYIIMKFGMSVLCGSPAAIASSHGVDYGESIISWLLTSFRKCKVAAPFECLQASPVLEWNDIIRSRMLAHGESFITFSDDQMPNPDIIKDKLLLMERVVFQFPNSPDDQQNANSLLTTCRALPEGYSIVPLIPQENSHFYLSNTFHIGPDTFFADAAAWEAADSVGYVALYEGIVVAIAFSAIRITKEGVDLAEIGVETSMEHRGKGLAWSVCAEMLKCCIIKHLTPVWCCRRGNSGSERLARSLGFIEKTFGFGPINYYMLPIAQE